MNNITELTKLCKEFLTDTANKLAISSGFIKRRRKLKGHSFVQALVLGNIGNSECSIEGMCQLLNEDSITISKQGLDYRFNESAVNFMKAVYEECLKFFKNHKNLDCNILQSFSNIRLLDSSNVALPESMKTLYKGHGSGYGHGKGSAKASIKLQTLYNYSTQTLSKIEVLSGVRSDQGYRGHLQEINENELLIADLGYFVPESFKIISDKGAYFISRYKADTNIYTIDGQQVDLLEILKDKSQWQEEILLGKVAQIPVRIVCRKLTVEQSQGRRRKANILAKVRGYTSSDRNQKLLDWSLFITNIPQHKVPIEYIATIYKARWQIELLFKLCKSQIKIETLKGTKNSSRILCELYAKLSGIALFHATVNSLGVTISHQISFTKAFLEFKRRIREFFIVLKSVKKLNLFFQNLRVAWSKFSLKDKYRKSTLNIIQSLPFSLT